MGSLMRVPDGSMQWGTVTQIILLRALWPQTNCLHIEDTESTGWFVESFLSTRSPAMKSSFPVRMISLTLTPQVDSVSSISYLQYVKRIVCGHRAHSKIIYVMVSHRMAPSVIRISEPTKRPHELEYLAFFKKVGFSKVFQLRDAAQVRQELRQRVVEYFWHAVDWRCTSGPLQVLKLQATEW